MDVEVINWDSVPKWLTKEYIQDVLQKFTKNPNVKILNIILCPVVNKGENFASVLIRAKVKYLRSDKDNVPQIESFVIKTSFENNKFCSVKLNAHNAYNREMEIYAKILPNITKLLENIKDDQNIFIESISVDYNHCAIILKDISVHSYVVAERVDGLNLTHTKLVLHKLAKFHAASAVFNETHKGAFKTYDYGMFSRRTNAFRPLFENNLIACEQMISQWDNEYKIYAKKLKELQPVLMEYGKKIFDVDENHFNCLVHGDLWINNIMFKYDDRNKPSDARIIDFQFSVWGSPALDLHYFFNTSLCEDLRLNHQEELLQYYYYILRDTLHKFQFQEKIPTLHEFRMQFIEKNFYAFTSACLIQPIILNKNTENTADFQTIMGEDERSWNFRKIIYSNKKVQKNLTNLLPIFERRGILDVS